MNKKVLILEASVTVQKLFITLLDRNEYDLKFEKEGSNFINEIFSYEPDIILLNAQMEDPGSFEIVRIIRTFSCFENLAIGMYVPDGGVSDEYFAKNCGANTFIFLNEKNLMVNMTELSQLSSENVVDKDEIKRTKDKMDDTTIMLACTRALQKDAINDAIIKKIYSMMHSWTCMEDIAKEFLEIIAEFSEVPAAALYLMENDGPHAYIICANRFSEENKNEFFKVCASDFEDLLPDFNLSMLAPNYIQSDLDMDKFYTKNVQLSSYECASLRDVNCQSFGSVHVVREGNFSKSQTELLNFCCESAGLLFENAIFLKKKMFFEKRIRKVFSRFVPEQIIDELVASDSSSENSVGEKKKVAVLFSDIRSFTNISEKNRPEVIVSFLNRYFTIMVDIIKKYGGEIDKFIGDAIMAKFGTPVDYEDNCDRAIAAACEMREALSTVPLEDLVLPDGMAFATGIGIHYGEMIVGAIGSSEKTEWSIIGSQANVSDGLEAMTKLFGVKILISGFVKDSCQNPNNFAFRYMGDVNVDGINHVVPVYSVDRTKNDFSREYLDSYNRGVEFFKSAQFAQAKEEFEKALFVYPDDKATKLYLSACDKTYGDDFNGAVL